MVAATTFRKAAFCAAFCFLALMPQSSYADASEDDGRSLIVVAGKGDMVTLQRLLKAGASVTVRDQDGRTALLAATHNNRIAAAKALIAAGADVNAKDSLQDSPFLYAGAEGRTEILKAIIATGKADLKSTNRYGGTALIPAAHHGHADAVEVLLATAIDKDHVNNLGWTALLEAIVLGNGGPAHTRIVKLLVEAGANINIADKDGVTPLVHAQRRGFSKIVKILESGNLR